MRVLLDENLNWRLKHDLPGHEVESVPLIGWAGIQNGALLRKAVESGFDALVTMDSNMVHQQDLSAHEIAVIVLRAHSNRLEDTRLLMPAVLQILPHAPRSLNETVPWWIGFSIAVAPIFDGACPTVPFASYEKYTNRNYRIFPETG